MACTLVLVNASEREPARSLEGRRRATRSEIRTRQPNDQSEAQEKLDGMPPYASVASPGTSSPRVLQPYSGKRSVFIEWGLIFNRRSEANVDHVVASRHPPLPLSCGKGLPHPGATFYCPLNISFRKENVFAE